ncbi:DUF7130 family rubredoxin-like protein (plasmid) [Halorientalis pallida]|uniref:DUF7130 family rubredoxin-like protein n=1 Tax=Halorientalis pallida TaxID=2479928 RepID=UPI003C6F0884
MTCLIGRSRPDTVAAFGDGNRSDSLLFRVHSEAAVRADAAKLPSRPAPTRSGHAFGQAELMWRCTNCGEMGEIDGDRPPTCSNCEVPREDLTYWTED